MGWKLKSFLENKAETFLEKESIPELSMVVSKGMCSITPTAFETNSQTLFKFQQAVAEYNVIHSVTE